jgi:ElaB/YqjD/DUF883 family membrane-anchored ribosome-binding protein
MDRTNIGGEKIMQDLKAVVSDTEALLHATAGDASERVVKARTRAEESLRHARTRMLEIEQQLLARGRGRPAR